MDLKDVELICKECGESFPFTAKEQQFYLKQGFEHVPTRCLNCRRQMREKRDKGRQFFTVKCKITGKVGRLPIEPDNPDDVYSDEAFEKLFAEKGHYIDPLKELDKTALLKDVESVESKEQPKQPEP